jgi:sarcosine oxidase subunit delta
VLIIPCPVCGPRDHAEFEYQGDATVAWPALDAPEAPWFEAVFLRDNPRGRHREFWRHLRGCGSWLVVERDTATHEIFGATLAHPGRAAAAAGAR